MDEPEPPAAASRFRRLRKTAAEAWRSYADSFCYAGLLTGVVFFAASVSPSLLPRTWPVQGVLSGFALALGYGIGVATRAVWRWLEVPRLPSRVRNPLRLAECCVAGVVFAAFVWRMGAWQNGVREVLGMPPREGADTFKTVLLALAVAAVLLCLGRVTIAAGRGINGWLAKFLPRRVAGAAAIAVTAFAVLTLANDVVARLLLRRADDAFAEIDARVDDGLEAPADDRLTGGAESIVPWPTIGRRGKEFLTAGPTADVIREVVGGDAKTPLRVYVGHRTSEDERLRAEIALQELIRLGGFDRRALIVATPTGTGWVDPGSVDAVEFLHRGDTAIVATQYSHLPSWMTLLVDPDRSVRAARLLFDEVYGHWKTLPKDRRPELYLFGLSLGALGSEESASLLTTLGDPIDGAVFSGPPFPSRTHAAITAGRNEGSPVWRPRVGDGAAVRFLNQRTFVEEGGWGPMRVAYLQYGSDPMVFFSPDLFWRRPEWLERPRAADVSDALRWWPVVTGLQVAFDLPLATNVPLGYGHNYAPEDYINAWLAVSDPPDWTPSDTRRLKSWFRENPPATAVMSP